MCPGKRSFWTSLAVSPFPGQSRGQRLLSLFDFGKTSPLLSGNFTDSPENTVLAELSNIASKTAQQPSADPGGTQRPHRRKVPRDLGKPRIKYWRFFWCGRRNRSKSTHRGGNPSFTVDFTLSQTLPSFASNSDTVKPHVVQLRPNFALSCIRRHLQAVNDVHSVEIYYCNIWDACCRPVPASHSAA